MRLALFAIVASCLRAQTPDIHGTVLEQGPNTPLPGVEIRLVDFIPVQDTLEERLVATAFTDDRGRFAFKPDKLGEYRLDVRKAGYTADDREQKKVFVILTKDRPVQEFQFSLMNPSHIAGQFVDEQDRPISGLRIFVQPQQGMLGGPPRNIATDSDGRFSADGIPPGPYLIRAVPQATDQRKLIEFSAAEFEKIDRDYENVFWPSGVPDEAVALPLIVPSGGTGNLGSIRLHQASYYRVHLRIEGDCSGDWKYALIPQPQIPSIINFSQQPLPCQRDLLLRNVMPGAYEFAIWRSAAPTQWAITPFVITNRNVEVTLRPSPTVNVEGKFVAAEGSKLPARLTNSVTVMNPMTRTQDSVSFGMVMLQPEVTGLEFQGANNAQVSADGAFAYKNLLWSRYRISVPRLSPTHYVKEIRYGGVPTPDGRIALAPGAALEIELDENPASIIVTAESATEPLMIVLARAGLEPRFADTNAPFSYLSPLEEGGAATFGSLAPGEYRIAAIPRPLFLPTASGNRKLDALIAAGEKVTVRRGEAKTVQLRLR
ncbi:MAG: hypothetical protein RL328_498 [Acidobacteriota bacterium]